MRSELNHKTVTKSSGAHRAVLGDEYLTSLFLCLLHFSPCVVSALLAVFILIWILL